ncbi:GyrI-like domain-containing protein [Lysobacter korlensis]|uniref:GyrI-like domain-containing protein n=1 Tax=Lysobacter korlensis TaxID=553636 RepID=A0ABV6RNF8_9GAMM
MKTDFRTERPDLYSPKADGFSVVDVPPFRFAMIDGRGDPNTSPEYAAAVEALYSVSYAAKFASKAELHRDCVVGPLEGLWDAERMASFLDRSKSEWRWTMMIRQPDWIPPELWEHAIAKAAKKRPGVANVRLETFTEGLSVQILHIGSYDDEGPTLARLHDEYLPAHGYAETGRHHEIYLSDPRRVAAAKLKTVLRQPVKTR